MGDAITCWIDGDDGSKATSCALDIQATMQELGQFDTDAGAHVVLAIKVAVAVGTARRFLVGDPTIQNIDVLAGELIDRLASAEQLAEPSPTTLTLTAATDPVPPGESTGLVATLTDGNGGPLKERTVYFSVAGTVGSRTVARITNLQGQATLGSLALPGGTYEVTARFLDTIPLFPAGELSLNDSTYTAAAGLTPTSTFQYAVIYDPVGGFVTGGGWIDSPEGAYAPDPTLTGKASFGFVAKYKKGQSTPSGNTQFKFNAAGLNFESVSYEWLVIAGTNAKYKGRGTINGAGDFGFMLTGRDGDSRNGGIDEFRIKIWDIATGSIVYDNEVGASDGSNDGTSLGGGSIKVHKAK